MAQNQVDEVYASLMEEAKKGTEDKLYELLGKDNSILEKADEKFRENPLHVAASHNNYLFAAELANLKPSLATSLNQDGLSPLHIAAGNGNLETVKKLLKANKELCFVRGREMMVPLHCAAKSGNPRSEEVIKEFLSACPKCITALTTRNETALHTAVKSRSSKNFQALVKWIKEQWGGYNILGWKNQDGNTILQLAASERNPEIVEMLLHKYGYFVKKAAKINTKNNMGRTALDVLLRTQTGPGPGPGPLCDGARATESQTQQVKEVVIDSMQREEDEEQVKNKIRKILQSSGAKGSEDISCTPRRQQKDSKATRALNSGIKWLLKVPNFLTFKIDRDAPSDVRNALLVILILIVSVTYTTGVSPPGGLWQDAGSESKSHIPGTSIWFDHHPKSFVVLTICNYAGFLVSVVLVFNLTQGYTLRGLILLALLFMLITYGLSIRVLFLGVGGITVVLINGMLFTIPLLVPFVLLVGTSNWLWDIKE